MTCTGSGSAGSCQVATFGTTARITVMPGLAGVRVRGPGLLTGFDDGVEIVGSHARVKGLTITGPACGPDECSRPVSQQPGSPSTPQARATPSPTTIPPTTTASGSARVRARAATRS